MIWNIFHWRSLKTKIMLFTLSIFMLSIWMLAFYASRTLREDTQRILGEQQFASASMLAAEINQEVDDRLRGMETLAAMITPASMRNAAAAQRLLEDQQVFQRWFNGGTFVIGADGTAIAEIPLSAARIGVNYMERDFIATVFRERKSTVSQPVIGKKLMAPIIGMTVPIIDPQGKVIGALAGVTDLGVPNFLDRINQSHYGKGGGYVLLSVKHRLIITATDKRRVMEVIPPPGQAPWIDRLAGGYEGSFVGVNPTGAEVLVSAKSIPAAGWFVQANLSTEEAFAPIRDMQQRMLLAAIFLTLLAGGLTWWLLHCQLEPMVAAARILALMSDTNQRPGPLPVARHDEAGELIGGFNRMLETLGKREKALKESEERSRAITHSAQDAVVTSDSEGNIAGWNPAAETLFGYTESEVIGQPMTLLIPERYRGVHLAGMHRIRSGGEHRVIGKAVELNGLRTDGSEFPLELSLAKWETDDGWFVTGIIRDITERKRAISQLLESESRYRRLIESSPDIVYVFSNQRGGIFYSPRVEALLGYHPDYLCAHPFLWSESIHPDDVQNVKRTVISTDVKDAFAVEYRIKDAQGNWHWFLDRSTEVRTESGELLIEGLVTDITERKRASEELRRSEARFRSYFNQPMIGIAITSPEKGWLEVNPRLCEILGYAREEIVRLTWSEITHPDDIASDVAQFERVLRGEIDGYSLDKRFVRKDGSTIHVAMSASGVRTDDGRIDYFVALIQDITERRRLEEVHLQAQRLESLGTLAGGIAHDFNNILAAIRGNADLATEDVGPGHIAAESLEEIRKASNRASELVRRIMAFGRPKEAQQEVVGLGAVLSEVLLLLRATVPAGISFEKVLANGTPHVLADSGQIHEALVNLTTNAAHAIGPKAGSIEYRLAPIQVDEQLAQRIPGLVPGLYARMTVADNGSGMDAATMERIFDAFYTTKPVGEGTGLGLSMVHGTMRSHGGAVAAESTLGKGSSFHLYFPAAVEQTVKIDEGALVQIQPLTGQRVLYLDDEKALVFLAGRMLSRLGHQVDSYTDADEALEAFRARPQDYDIVVTDLSMPRMSGIEFASEVLGVRPGMPVLMMTGHVSTDDERNAHALGIREVILKPITMDELARVLDRLLRTSQ